MRNVFGYVRFYFILFFNASVASPETLTTRFSCITLQQCMDSDLKVIHRSNTLEHKTYRVGLKAGCEMYLLFLIRAVC